ncbi:peptidase [Parabacteroides sp. 52]|uniref:PepSY-associated TM helix domain-containing protein n=1 Tax=unclassified Parabacteroides TaxID=2649774 RepID=UPI0013D23493|nr:MULTISPECIES: PepSY-associated TM helix domain-containing protein [unclassified Parabacteroides]MDH6535136.1 hypothetical protein [Parabacteroides sp. PM5-20]NDV56177.1 peptidase [Parabacteroides sp. 52]
MKFKSNSIRKWGRIIHRDLSFFFSGMILIYSISGIVMNHRDTINPNFTVERKEYVIAEQGQGKEKMDKAHVLSLLEPLGEKENYTKHYFPQPTTLKVFLKGGSNLVVDTSNGHAVYESVKRRHFLSAVTKLHYNPGKWWTHFADVFAIALILITLTGLILVKGNKGLGGRGGIELIAGILVPLAFLFFF